MSEKTARQIIAELKEKYSDNTDALEEIARRENDINYIETKEQQGGYNGQSAVGLAKMLEAELATWF